MQLRIEVERVIGFKILLPDACMHGNLHNRVGKVPIALEDGLGWHGSHFEDTTATLAKVNYLTHGQSCSKQFKHQLNLSRTLTTVCSGPLTCTQAFVCQISHINRRLTAVYASGSVYWRPLTNPGAMW